VGLFGKDVEDALIWTVGATNVFFHAILVFLLGFSLRPRLHAIIKIGLADRFNPVLPFLSHSNLHFPIETNH